ncbi:MAG: hypothetical protein HY952_03465, partial [Elusimicrobia bacterium]|nr:hypothetical protein [Elusimicrobiota bacterium]
LLCAAMPALAQDKAGDEKKLEKASMAVDKDAADPAGAVTVTDKLKAEFGVDDARVQGLRDQKLGYGEISIALALAKDLPGGITDANVQKVMALRQGPPVMGWGKVAKELGFNLGKVISSVKKLDADVRKKAAAEKAAAAKAKGNKGEKGEKMERSEKPERPGRMERPAKPEHHGKQ